jgi:hypothetical protein
VRLFFVVAAATVIRLIRRWSRSIHRWIHLIRLIHLSFRSDCRSNRRMNRPCLPSCPKIRHCRNGCRPSCRNGCRPSRRTSHPFHLIHLIRQMNLTIRPFRLSR